MTSTTLAAAASSPAWLKRALADAGVFVLCWGGAIWYWRGAERAPDGVDLALLLLVLPLGVLGGVWIGSKVLATRVPAAGATPAATAAQAPLAAPAGAPLAILATALRSPHGASAEELAAAIAAGQARPDLDPELVDDDGFPVMSARSSDAVDEALQEEISAWLAGQGMAQLRWSEAQWRALTLGTAVTRDLAAQAVSELMPLEGEPPPLRLLPLLPPGWTVEQRSAASLWLKHVVVQFGWPAKGVTWIDVDAQQATPAAVLGQLAQDAAMADTRVAALLVAFASHLDQDTVDDWAGRGVLFAAARPQGVVPGEGAAGLLLADVMLARAAGALFAHLERPLTGRRDNSIDATRRADPALLAELTGSVLAAGALDAASVALVVADAGQRANRALELAGTASARLPQLDGNDDVLRVGAALGSCDMVPFVCALALAHHHVLERAAPVLCVANEDPYERCVAAMRLAEAHQETEAKTA